MLDNGLPTNALDYFAIYVDGGGGSRQSRYAGTDTIYDYFPYLEIGGEVFNLYNRGSTPVLQGDKVVSDASLSVPGGTIDVHVESRIPNGTGWLINTYRFTASGGVSLRDAKFFQYLDSDIYSISDDVLKVSGATGTGDLTLTTIDPGTQIRLEQILGQPQLGAAATGFAAERYSSLKSHITAGGFDPPPEGYVDTNALPLHTQAGVGECYGPGDVTTAIEYSFTSATSAILRTTLGVSDLAVGVPDLLVTHVSEPVAVRRGQSLPVSWIVQNRSDTAAAAASWTDRVFLSTDQTLSADDRSVGTLVHTGGLAARAVYNATLNVDTSTVPDGLYYLLVATDSTDVVEEGRLDGNNATASESALWLGVPELVPGTPLPGMLQSSGQACYYVVSMAEGQHLQITLDDANDIGHNELYVRYGQPPTRSEYDARYTTNLAADQEVLVPDTLPGLYYVMAYGESVPDAPGVFAINASLKDLAVLGLSPVSGGNTGNVTLTIHGVGVPPDASVELLSPSGTVLRAVRVLNTGGEWVYATFGLRGQEAGLYDVRVAKPGGSAVSLADAFRVQTGTGARFEAHLLTPSVVRAGVLTPITVTYANTGDVDMATPYLLLDAEGRDILLGDPSFDPQSGLALPAVAVPANPLVLPPQASGSFRVYCMSTQGTLNLHLKMSSSLGELGVPLDYATSQTAVLAPSQPGLLASAASAALLPLARQVMLTLDDCTTAETRTLTEAAREVLPGVKVGLFVNMERNWSIESLWGAKNPLEGMKYHPKVLQQLVADGHIIGDHGNPHATCSLGNDPQRTWQGHLLFEQAMDSTCQGWRSGNPELWRGPGWTASPETQRMLRDHGVQLVGGYSVGDWRIKMWQNFAGLSIAGLAGRAVMLELVANQAVADATRHLLERPNEPFVLVLHQDFVTPDDLKYILAKLRREGFDLSNFDPSLASGYPWYGSNTGPSPESQLDSRQIPVVRSFDPNEMVGPAGLVPELDYVARGAELPYTVYFENDPNLATAPAQAVQVTNVLDSGLDPATFELREIVFGSHTLTVPPGLNYYATTLDLRSEGTNLLVKIEAGLDSNTGTATWTLKSLDPLTLAPPDDPFVGFLPVNDAAHRGEGYVSYAIRPKADLPSRTVVQGAASIVFDVNEPIQTNTAVNTVITPYMQTLTPGIRTSKWTFSDLTRDLVTVTLGGRAGSAQVLRDVPPGQPGDALALVLDGTDAKSSVTIATKIGAETSVGDIIVRGSIAGLTGKTTDLLRNLSVTGTLQTLELADATGGGLIRLGGLPTSKTAAALTLNSVADLAIDSTMPIRSIRATEWLDTDGTVDLIRAPSLGSLVIKGQRGIPHRGVANLVGDFEANLAISGESKDATGKALGSVSIKGSVGANSWDIRGKVGPVAISGAVGEAGQPWQLRNAASIASLTLGDVTNATVAASGSVGAIKAMRWLDGSISAASIASIATSGKAGFGKVAPILGNFGADVTLTGTAKSALGTLAIAGWLDGAMIVSTDRPLGTLTVGGIRNSTITAGDMGPKKTSINGLTVVGIKGQTYAFVNSNVAAYTLGRVSVKGVDPVGTPGQTFGITGHTMTSYSRNGKITPKPPLGTVDQWGGYLVQLS
jgi:hypothetical protein